MQDNFNKQIKRYIKRVKRNMKLLPDCNKQMLADFENNVFDFIEKESVRDFDKILQHFGSHQDVLYIFAKEEEAPILLKKLRNRKILLAISVFLLILTVSFLAVLIAECFEPKGYFVTYYSA